MRFRSLLSSLALMPALLCAAQTKTNPNTGINWPLATGAGAPSSACTSLNYGQPYLNTTPTPNTYYTCGADGWQIRGASTSFPSTPGFVYNTSPSASRNGTVADFNTLFGFTPGPIAALPTNGLLFDYTFNETTGSVLFDQSGNGLNATVSNSPIRTGLYYGFSAFGTYYVTLPTGANAANTYHWLVDLPVASIGSTVGNFGFLMDTTEQSTPTKGLRVFTSTIAGGVANNSPGTYGVAAQDGTNSGSFILATTSIFGGKHVISLACDVSGSPRAYLDGYLLTNSGSTGSCNALQTSGNLLFGSIIGNYYEAIGYTQAQTPADILQTVTSIRTRAQAKGVSFTPVPFSNAAAQIFIAGDSIPCGTGLTGGSSVCAGGTTASNAYPNLTPPLLNNPYQMTDFGVPSAYVQQQIISADSFYIPLCNATTGRTPAGLHEGTNNFQVISTVTASQVYQLQAAWAGKMRFGGCRPFLIAMLSRTGTTGSGAAYDTAMVALNALGRSGWKAAGYDGYVSVGDDPLLGCVGCAAVGANFPDGIHPSATMHVRLSTAVACVVNGMDGSSPASMSQTAQTTTSGTLTCADGGINFDPTGGNIARTMNSALWQAGRQVRFCNVATSGTNTVTLTAPGDFNFNNRTGSTTVVITPGNCANFESTWNQSTSTPGDFWKTM